MSIRNLDCLFKPRSVALVGASLEPRSVGATVAHNLFNSGFKGPVMPVNPRHRAVEGVLAYKDALDLPVVPDLVVIATPPPTVPELIEAFGRRGTRAAVVITAGFGEGGSAEGGVLALDARIRVRPTDAPPGKRLAIRPYPKELEQTLTLPDGREFLLRPVLPEDEPAFQRLFAKLSPDEIRMRFFAPKKR